MAGNNYHLPTKNDFLKMLEDIDGHVDLKLGSFIVPIVMYCVSFPYILNNNASEYIAWILIFFLNVTFPFTYLNELFSLGRKTLKTGIPGYIVIFSICSIVVAYILQFINLLFVILKNENIRKGKEKKGDYDNEGKQDLDTKDWEVEFRDKNISILFITSAALLWTMVLNHFSYDLTLNLFNPGKIDATNNSISQLTQMEEKFPIGSRIQWFVHLIPKILSYLDGSWHEVIDNIPIGTLVKSSIVYCIAFITIIFTVFIRLTYARQKLKTLGPDGYHTEEVRIVKRKGHTLANMGSLFGKTFQNNIRHIRTLAIVSIVFFIIIFGGMFGYLAKDFIPIPEWFRFEHGLAGWAVVCCAVLFPAFFAEKTHTKNKIMHKIFPMYDSIYFKRENIITHHLDEFITVYYSSTELLSGELKLNKDGSDKSIKTVITELGYYFKTYLFTNDTINNLNGSTTDDNHVDVIGTMVDVQKSFDLLEKKLQNINGFDVSVPKSKERDYDRFKPEFKSIMEQIYMQNYNAFAVDRGEFANANPGMEYPFIFEDSTEYKNKKKIYETNSNNMPLKTYIFFLVCLLFGFLSTLVIMTASNVIGGVSNKSFYTVFSVVMILSTIIMFGIGLGNQFLSPENDKDLQMFLVVLFTMMGASFFALSTRFHMLTLLWKISGTCLTIFLKTVAPIAIVLFTSLSISYSFKNYKRFKNPTSE